MRKIIVRIFSVLFILSLLLGVMAIYLDLHLYLRPTSPDLNTAIREQLEAGRLPGAAIAMLKNNQMVFAHGYGYANIAEQRPVTPDTIFQIASVSKLVTATTLMRLYDQGKFQLDDDINAYLPFSVRNPRFPEVSITFRMLLAHTSSISDGPSYDGTYTVGVSEDPLIALSDYLAGYFTPNGASYNAEKNFTEKQPGTTFEYSNVGFGLVGYLVERISGETFDQVCQREVFEPLGMTSSHWFHRDVDKTRWAMPYGYDMFRRTFTPLGAYSFATYPDGALKTSVNDFSRFLTPFINDGKTPEGQPFLKPETLTEMLKVQYPESGETVGLAWHIDETKDIYHHSGGDPGITTIVAIQPEKHIALITFTNGGGMGDLGDLRSGFAISQLVKTIYPRLINEFGN